MCVLNLKIGSLIKRAHFYVQDVDLDYAILGLRECKLFELVIDCRNCCVFQDGVKLRNVHNANYLFTSFHIIPSNTKKLIQNQGNKVPNTPTNCQNSVNINNFNHNVHVQGVNSNCFQDNPLESILGRYADVFSKDKYDVGKIRVEPQRIRLKSDLPISMRPYRTSIHEEQEINQQVQALLKAGLIQDSNSPYSAPVTLAFKRDEGKKTRLCVDFRDSHV